jgi:Tfp pilus assembly protein PilX
MRTLLKRNHPEAGVALIIALLTLLILSVLAASIIFVTQTETWATANNRSMVQARYAAEAGAQKTLNWLAYTYNPPTAATMAAFDTTKYPIQLKPGGGDVILSAMANVAGTYPAAEHCGTPPISCQTAFSNTLMDASVPGVGVPASYEVTARLLSIQGPAVQTWEITSQGNVASIRNAQVQVVMKVEKRGTPLFQYGIFANGNGCKAIDMSSSSYTDSFDSSAGSYAATAQTSGGNVGTNGNVNLSGSAHFDGTLSSPNGGTGACAAGAETAVTSSSSVNPPTLGLVSISPLTCTAGAGGPFPCPPLPPSPVPPTTADTMSGDCGTVSGCTNLGSKDVALAPGQYGDITASGGTTVHLSAGTYNVNNLVLSGGSPIVVDSGPVIINVEGAGVTKAIDFSGGSITNSSGDPSNLQIYYGGSDTVTLSGGSGSYGVVYAPNAPTTLSGASAWYGAVVGLTLTDSGGGAIHYDRALQNKIVVGGQFYPISFTWSKF